MDRIQRKSLYLNIRKPIGNDFFSVELIEVIKKDIEALAWLYNFMKDE